ncbi:MAG: hypothetical protein ABL866_13075 [Devosia sp.]
MAWVLQEESDKEIIAEIAKQSDRGAMVIAGSFIETRLINLIYLRLDPDATTDELGKMFKGSGAAATFSAKIDLGKLLQLYPASFAQLLHKVRLMRNDAAHETTPISFETPSVIARCEHWKTILMPVFSDAAAHHFRMISLDGRRRGMVALEEAAHHMESTKSMLDDGTVLPGASAGISVDASTRDIFMFAVQGILQHFHQTQSVVRSFGIVLPPLPGRSERQ